MKQINETMKDAFINLLTDYLILLLRNTYNSQFFSISSFRFNLEKEEDHTTKEIYKEIRHVYFY